MNQAIDDYLMRKYVTVELMRILDTLPSTAQSYPEAVTMRNKINAMSSQYPLVESEVTSLGDEVDHWYTMLVIGYDNMYVQFSTPNAYDKPVNFECPPGKTITGIKSWHSDKYEDRQFQFKCGYTPNMYPLVNCRWSGLGETKCAWSSYKNSMDGGMDFSYTPSEKFIKGAYSYHSDYYE
nr:hypothetical protein BaRGS_010999 [Batillaria attramentaria]